MSGVTVMIQTMSTLTKDQLLQKWYRISKLRTLSMGLVNISLSSNIRNIYQ